MGFKFLIILMVTIATTVAFPINNQIYLQLPHSGPGGHRHSDLNCLSWRLAVESNNLRNWIQLPKACIGYISRYMLGKQYRDDCDLVAAEAYMYAKGLSLPGDGKDVWVFDVDETTLSNIPYFLNEGGWVVNETSYIEWFEKGEAPAIQGPLKLYKKLIKLGFKIVFITGLPEIFTEPRSRNLKAVGYTEWEKLILKGVNDDASAVVYKSSKRKELEEGGYRIRGNMGDQWSDLLGSNPGDRTFKLPNPLYYIP